MHLPSEAKSKVLTSPVQSGHEESCTNNHGRALQLQIPTCCLHRREGFDFALVWIDLNVVIQFGSIWPPGRVGVYSFAKKRSEGYAARNPDWIRVRLLYSILVCRSIS
jgi:hypothetical protein